MADSISKSSINNSAIASHQAPPPLPSGGAAARPIETFSKLSKPFEALFIDLNGTVSNGESINPDVRKGLALAKRRGQKVAFVTNSGSSVEEIEDFLKTLKLLRGRHFDAVFTAGEEAYAFLSAKSDWRIGIPHDSTQLYTDYLYRKLCRFRREARSDVSPGLEGRDQVFCFEKTYHNDKRDFADLADWASSRKLDVLWLYAFKTQFGYGKEADYTDQINQLLGRGVKVIHSNPDRVYVWDGQAQDNFGGRVLRKHKNVIPTGKPDGNLLKMALEWAGCEPSKALMLGDQPSVDLAAAENAGCKSALYVGPGCLLQTSRFVRQSLDAILASYSQCVGEFQW